MYQMESRIRYSETDADGRLTPEKLIDYFQDCSTFQSEDNGLGVERLRHKETDRAAAIEEALRQMGVPDRVEEDEMVVEGMGLSQRLATGRLLKGGKFHSHSDHRMVMALKVAALGADSPVEIDDVDCVAKSFPNFNELFNRL